ncbi:NUDIX domain-containing protein [Bradyrhizobium sp.]|uniref:NUDIX domain-containing protein n=1 Tax=Bradyrhizobium sp. TaxID=376 RepID=UPI002D374FA2|nr:NUDIX domain-containing protein [Bradyrhizobium sp.]HZR77500.1 NUDIX domain-containing protein [Bradyrhizobium sp.]
MPIRSAGILVFRRRQGKIEVLLAHPGGPYWRNKDAGAWSIPKGECGPGESPEVAARREFREELGIEPVGTMFPLPEVRQRGGKIVTAFALEMDVNAETAHSNEFEIEWPPRSGQFMRFPEIDRTEWFDLASAYGKINLAQKALLEGLELIADKS